MHQTLILPHFKKQLKAYAKKYKYLKEVVIKTIQEFKKEQHTSLGGNIYKIRIKSKDILKGKSKSFRLLIFIIETGNYIVPIAIYFKGDKEDLTKKEINDHLAAILFELRLQKLLR